MDLLICVGIGLAGGLCVGFVLGVEHPKRCAGCLSEGGRRYRGGYQAGWAEGTAYMADLVRRRAVKAKTTWTITHGELDRAEADVLEIGRD